MSVIFFWKTSQDVLVICVTMRAPGQRCFTRTRYSSKTPQKSHSLFETFILVTFVCDGNAIAFEVFEIDCPNGLGQEYEYSQNRKIEFGTFKNLVYF